MKQQDTGVEELLEAARRTAAGGDPETSLLVALPDKAVLKAIRKASPEEVEGLFRMLARLSKRARRVAVSILGRESSTEVWVRARGLLEGLEPPHPLVLADKALDGVLREDGSENELLQSLEALEPALVPAWCRLAVPRLLDAPPGRSETLVVLDELGRSLIQAVAASGDDRAAAWVQAMAERSDRAATRKALKAAAYRLQQAGHEVSLPEQRASVSLEPEEPELIGFATPIDTAGERGLWLAGDLGFGGFAVAQALVSETLGIRRFELGEMRKRDFDSFVAELRGENRVSLFELAPSHVMGLMEEAYFVSPAASDRDYAASRATLNRTCRAALEPPSPELVPAGTSSLIGAFEVALLEHPFVSSWVVGEALAAHAEQQLEELGTSGLVLPGHSESDRRESTLLAVLREHADRDWLTRLKRRLEETAHLLLADSARDLGHEALRAAGSLGTDEPERSHFLQALLQRTLERRKKAREEEGEGLIVDPWGKGRGDRGRG